MNTVCLGPQPHWVSSRLGIQIEPDQLVLHLPHHPDHQVLLIHQQVDHLVNHTESVAGLGFRLNLTKWSSTSPNTLTTKLSSSTNKLITRSFGVIDRTTEAVPTVLLLEQSKYQAAPATGPTCLALMHRMYHLASLSPRWASCQSRSRASEQSWRDVCRHSSIQLLENMNIAKHFNLKIWGCWGTYHSDDHYCLTYCCLKDSLLSFQEIWDLRFLLHFIQFLLHFHQSLCSN